MQQSYKFSNYNIFIFAIRSMNNCCVFKISMKILTIFTVENGARPALKFQNYTFGPRAV
jgi:hypothetical protein